MTWESQAIALLTASLVRPFALAGVAWLLLRVLRVRHPASRHAVWTAVLVGMLLLPAVTVFAPHWKLPLLPAKRLPVPHSVAASPRSSVGPSAEEPADIPQTPTAPQRARFHLPSAETLLLMAYFAGLIAMLSYRAMGWVLLWRVISRSKRVRARCLLESSDVLTPVAVGVLRPAVLLPTGWRGWDLATRRAVLAHEFAHLRRRDALVSALARLAQCAFWFHPLAWWLSRKTSDLAELACDAAALERVDDPAGYSRILLQFADAVNRAGQRVALPGLAMASVSGMGRRIDQVFELSDGRMRRLSRPAIVLAVLGTPVMCFAAVIALGERSAPKPQPVAQPAIASASEPTPVSITQETPPPQSAPPKTSTPAPAEAAPQPQQLPRSLEPPPPQSTAPAPAAPQKFDVVSIKPCASNEPAGRGGRGGGRGGPGGGSPGRINLACRTVASLIEDAYVRFADGQLHTEFHAVTLEGGPSWINSERYQINAEAEGAPGREVMNGPMLQAVLEERFQLKTHRETKDVPVYVLTLAKGGLKMKAADPSGCMVLDLLNPPPPNTSAKPFCGHPFINVRPPNFIANMHSTTMDEVADWLAPLLDRRVINETAISGAFDGVVEFVQDDSIRMAFRLRGGEPAPEPTGVPGQSIFTAVQDQLGLKLDSLKRPGQSLVIDRIERPTEN